MNKHILLVMKWLNDKDSVTQEELEKNSRDACVAAAHYATCAAAVAAAYAAYDAVADARAVATYWVDKYFELTSEDINEYEKELEK